MNHVIKEILLCYAGRVTLSDLFNENPNLFPRELNMWVEKCEFFKNECAVEDLSSARWQRLKAVVLVMIMINAIRQGSDCELLNGKYFRTSTSISPRAMVVVRYTPEKKIEVESWPKNSRHSSLSDWDWDL